MLFLSVRPNLFLVQYCGNKGFGPVCHSLRHSAVRPPPRRILVISLSVPLSWALLPLPLLLSVSWVFCLFFVWLSFWLSCPSWGAAGDRPRPTALLYWSKCFVSADGRCWYTWVLATLMAAWGVQLSQPMPWTRQHLQWGELACPEPPALLLRAPAQQSLPSWLVLELASADFCPTLRVSWRVVPDVLSDEPLTALDDGDDPHEVPEQLVQWCIFYFYQRIWRHFLDDFFDKSLSSMLAVWPCRLFLCLGPRCRPVTTRNWWQSKTSWIPATTHGLYTHAWQLPDPLQPTNLFEDRQSTAERTLRLSGPSLRARSATTEKKKPERTLRWLPLCTVAFSNLVAAFHSCLAFHPLFLCLGHRLVNSFVHISETRWFYPYRVGGNPHDFV